METRASYVLVGAFLLGLIAAGIVFLLWLAGQRDTTGGIALRIHFRGDVTGLDQGSNVRYRGIPMGKVSRIRIFPENADIIEVFVRVRVDTPIWTDTVARLETQGLTGSPFVQLLRPAPGARPAGAPEPTRLSARDLREADPPHLLRGQPTELQRIFEELPKAVSAITKLATRATVTVDRASAFLDDDTRRQFRTILGNFEVASTRLRSVTEQAGALLTKENRELIEGILKDTQTAMADLGPAVKRLSSAVGNVEKSAKSFGDMSAQIEGLVRENRRPLRNFTATGLYEFGQFISDFRKLINTMDRLVRRIERDPSGFFFGQTRGYQPGRR